MVMEVVQEDMYEGGMQCIEHPFKNSTQGGICAFCLQEKLGKLVSSSFPVAIFPSSSSSLSSSPSFRSDTGTTNNTSSSSTNIHAKRAKLPFLLTQKKKNKKEAMMAAADASNLVFKRSKSTATPRKASNFMEDYSPQRKGFWSFLYLSHPTTTKKTETRPHKVDISTLGTTSMNGVDLIKLPRERKREELVVVEENESPDQERKVSRSRSVGCGSRSFSGDFLERISTGFGDCTLRRVESQREGKSRIHSMNGNKGQDCIKERVKCRGIFSGFIITSSSSSSSSSSYMVSSKIEENFNNGKTTTTTTRTTSTTPASHHHMRNLVHARSKSWGWAFASPMRAFSKPSSSGKRDSSMKKATSTTTPNLAAIPSLLAARG